MRIVSRLLVAVSLSLVFSVACFAGDSFAMGPATVPGWYYNWGDGDSIPVEGGVLQATGTYSYVDEDGRVLTELTSEAYKYYATDLEASAIDGGAVKGLSPSSEVEGISSAQDAESLKWVEGMELDGTTLPTSVSEGFDATAATAGFMPSVGTMLGAVSEVTVGAAAFQVGVEIGNGIDSFFGLPEWEEFGLQGSDEGPLIEYIQKVPAEYKADWRNRGESEIEGPTGWYIGGCLTSLEPTWYPSSPWYVEHGRYGTPETYYCNGDLKEPAGGEEIPSKDEGLVTWFVCETPAEVFAKCYSSSLQRQYNTSGPQIEGIPFREGPLTNTETEANRREAEKNQSVNKTLNLPSVPKTPEISPPAKHKVGTGKLYPGTHVPYEASPEFEKTSLKELPAVKELQKGAEEHHETRTEKELEEGLVIPSPNPTEHGEEFKERLEREGFTKVELKTLPETEVDSSVGPYDVAEVSPAEGSLVAPDRDVDVTQNPASAPEPGSSGALGSPTLPGIHLPDLGVLCTKFPFGVPCWLYEEFDGWATTAVVPKWTIPIEVPSLGWKTELLINLSFMESAMEEYIRPTIIALSVIGLLVLFYGFATGGGSTFDDNGQGVMTGEGFE